MGIFIKSRREKLLSKAKWLCSNYSSKTMDLSKGKKITEYEQNILLWAFFGARSLVYSLLNSKNFLLYQVADNLLGDEINAETAYEGVVITLIYIHNQRMKNSKKLYELANYLRGHLSIILNNLFSLEKDVVKDYINLLTELQSTFPGNTLDVFQNQMLESSKKLLTDGKNVNILFENSGANLLFPAACNVYLTELAKAADKMEGLSYE
jgi:hypothetical protein